MTHAVTISPVWLVVTSAGGAEREQAWQQITAAADKLPPLRADHRPPASRPQADAPLTGPGSVG